MPIRKHAIAKLAIMLAATFLTGLLAGQPLQAYGASTATPGFIRIEMNDTTITLESYRIFQEDYCKLQDLAYLLKDTSKQFDIGSNKGMITLTSGKAYTPTGTEMQLTHRTENKTAFYNSNSIYLNGSITALPVYNMDGCHYVSVLKLGALLNFYAIKDSFYDMYFLDADTVYAKKLPMLMYHTSSEYTPGALTELYVKPSEFEKQIQYFNENNYTFCTFDNWHQLQKVENPIFITFDDGYRENYTEIFPILKKYNAKMTLFLTTDLINEPSRLSEEMIREMSDSGLVKFESHTLSHPDLASISADTERLINEMSQSKTVIENITGIPVVALAYPHGSYNQKVIEIAKSYYYFGLRSSVGMHTINLSNYEIRRLIVARKTTMNEIIAFSAY